VLAIVGLAIRVPPAMRETVIREGKAMLVAHFGAADARFGIGSAASGERAGHDRPGSADAP